MDLAHRRGRNAATAVIAGRNCVGARMLANGRRTVPHGLRPVWMMRLSLFRIAALHNKYFTKRSKYVHIAFS
ncbi:hypothetical protein ACVINH_005964 [Rhizobium anhuiense]